MASFPEMPASSPIALGRDEVQTDVPGGSVALWRIFETECDGFLDVLERLVNRLALAVAPFQVYTLNPISFSGLVGVDDDGE